MPATTLSARFRQLVLATLLSLGLLTLHAAAPAQAHACEAAAASIASVSGDRLERATLCLINRKRAEHGLRRVTLSRRLSRAAVRHSRDMVRRDFFSHVSPGGRNFLARIKRTGYLRGARSWSAAENIAWGSGRLGSPQAIVRAWMRSPGHRRNILGRFRNIGLGIVRGTPARYDGATYTNTFGRR